MARHGTCGPAGSTEDVRFRACGSCRRKSQALGKDDLRSSDSAAERLNPGSVLYTAQTGPSIATSVMTYPSTVLPLLALGPCFTGPCLKKLVEAGRSWWCVLFLEAKGNRAGPFELQGPEGGSPGCGGRWTRRELQEREPTNHVRMGLG